MSVERQLPRDLAVLVVRLDGQLQLMAMICAVMLFLLLLLALGLLWSAGALTGLYERYGPAVSALGIAPLPATLAAYRAILWACKAYADSYARKHLL